MDDGAEKNAEKKSPVAEMAEYLRRLRSGDRELFTVLVRNHHPALLALARQFVGGDADEVVQSAWVKAYQAIAEFEGRSQVRTWLGRIVINEAYMWLRHQKREILSGELGNDSFNERFDDRFDEHGRWQHPPTSWSTDSPEALLTADELADCLDRLLAAMPPNQRAVLEMRDSAGLSFDTICNDLEVSASNVRVLLHRARTQLFKLVDHFEETGEC